MLKDLKLEIVYKPIDSIVGYVNNTRVHSQEQINQIKSSIVEFGMCNPIGLHNNTIIFGHGRWEALKQLDYKEVPTIDLSHLSEAQKKALIIADNKIALNSTFDEELLKLEIEALQDMDFNIDLLGFSDEELADLEIEIQDEKIEPNIKEDTYREKFEIIIECDNELQQEQIFYDLDKKGYKCRVQSL